MKLDVNEVIRGSKEELSKEAFLGIKNPFPAIVDKVKNWAGGQIQNGVVQPAIDKIQGAVGNAAKGVVNGAMPFLPMLMGMGGMGGRKGPGMPIQPPSPMGLMGKVPNVVSSLTNPMNLKTAGLLDLINHIHSTNTSMMNDFDGLQTEDGSIDSDKADIFVQKYVKHKNQKAMSHFMKKFHKEWNDSVKATKTAGLLSNFAWTAQNRMANEALNSVVGGPQHLNQQRPATEEQSPKEIELIAKHPEIQKLLAQPETKAYLESLITN